MKKYPEEVYLGDGLYALYDGFMVVLRAPRDSGHHWIGMEPEVLRNFERFIANLKEEKNAVHD